MKRLTNESETLRKAMLDPWIIEEILRREEDRRREEDGNRLELPVESPKYKDSDQPAPPSDETERGVTIIDI